MSHTPILIGGVWASVISTLMASAVIGGVGFAWNQHGATVELHGQISDLRDAKLPDRLSTVEAKLDSSNKSLDRIESKLDSYFQSNMQPQPQLIPRQPVRSNQ